MDGGGPHAGEMHRPAGMNLVRVRRSAGGIDENLGAADIQRTAAELRDIDRAASQIEAHGARYPEAMLKMVGR